MHIALVITQITRLKHKVAYPVASINHLIKQAPIQREYHLNQPSVIYLFLVLYQPYQTNSKPDKLTVWTIYQPNTNNQRNMGSYMLVELEPVRTMFDISW